MYTDAEPAVEQEAPPPEAQQPEAPPKEETQEQGNVAELPKSVLGGKEFKPGDEVVLEIVQVGEESVVVKYATEGKGEEYGEAPPPAAEEAPPQAPPPGGMRSMME